MIFFLIFSIFLKIIKANTVAGDLEKLTAEVVTMLAAKIKTSDWCNKVAENVTAANVTTLHIPTQIRAIHDICGPIAPIVKFASTVLPFPILPTGQPTSTPSSYTPPRFRSFSINRRSFSTFALIIFLIIIIACLRCCLICFAFCGVKTSEKSHLYDIFVILNHDEEAIFENVRHEDIMFLRRYVRVVFFNHTEVILC